MIDKKTRERSRLDRAANSVRRAEKFAAFLADPDIAAYFAAYERDQIENMIKAVPTDDEQRRSAALMINAMREFRGFLMSAIASGETSLNVLRESADNA